MKICLTLCLLTGLLCACRGGPQTGAGIVSLDLCADQYVVDISSPDDILAVSYNATTSFSYVQKEARSLRTHRGRVEEVLALQPKLVVRSYGGADMIPHLKRAGIEIVQIGYPQTLDEAKLEYQRVTAELGTQVADDFGVSDAKRPPRNLTALYLTPGGVTAGPGTFVDDLVVAAGLTNYQSKPGWQTLPLEELLDVQPDMLITSFFDSEFGTATAWSPSAHPIIARLIDTTPTISVPASLVSCNAWYAEEAVTLLAQARVSR